MPFSFTKNLLGTEQLNTYAPIMFFFVVNFHISCIPVKGSFAFAVVFAWLLTMRENTFL